MKFFDKLIEKIFKKILHKNRNHHIDKAIKNFNLLYKQYDADPEIIAQLRANLEAEADRLYPMVDKSILRERVRRGKYIFWMTAILLAIIITTLIIVTDGSALLFITPLSGALVSWIVTLATIPIGYEERIEGGMDSSMMLFAKNLAKALKSDEKNTHTLDLKQQIETLHGVIKNQNEKISTLENFLKNQSEKIDMLSNQMALLTKNENNPSLPLSPKFHDPLPLNVKQTQRSLYFWKNKKSRMLEICYEENQALIPDVSKNVS